MSVSKPTMIRSAHPDPPNKTAPSWFTRLLRTPVPSTILSSPEVREYAKLHNVDGFNLGLSGHMRHGALRSLIILFKSWTRIDGR